VAFHCGSTRNGSNLHGLLDAIDFAGGQGRLHICHVNAYCRGLTHGSPVQETMIALEALAANPHLISESHLAPFNSCWSRLENGAPRSHVTRTCLAAGGYAADRQGLREAAGSGYLKVQKSTEHGVVFLEPAAGLDHLEAVNYDTMVSFPVNRRSTAFLTATEKNERNEFIATAISTDGGGIPRNYLLSHGLSLVRFEALTLAEWVHKCAWAPARMLGLNSKGHLNPGADGDLVVVDPDTQSAELTVAAGRAIMIHGLVIGRGGTIVTTQRGQKTLQEQGVPCLTADLPGSLLYQSPEPGSNAPIGRP